MGPGKSLWVKTWRKWVLLSKGAYLASRWEEVVGRDKNKSPHSVLCLAHRRCSVGRMNEWTSEILIPDRHSKPDHSTCLLDHTLGIWALKASVGRTANSQCYSAVHTLSKSLAYHIPSTTSNWKAGYLRMPIISSMWASVRTSNKSFEMACGEGWVNHNSCPQEMYKLVRRRK